MESKKEDSNLIFDEFKIEKSLKKLWDANQRGTKIAKGICFDAFKSEREVFESSARFTELFHHVEQTICRNVVEAEVEFQSIQMHEGLEIEEPFVWIVDFEVVGREVKRESVEDSEVGGDGFDEIQEAIVGDLVAW